MFNPNIDLDMCFQILIKKDREDQNDATMSEFFDKLATTYQDPALMPIQYSADSESLNRPLIPSAEMSMWGCLCTVLTIELNSSGGFYYQPPFPYATLDLSFIFSSEIASALKNTSDAHVSTY